MDRKRNVSLVIEQPQPMRKQVYEHLRNQILNHVIEPSSRLVEAQIAKEIGTSRTPVREAMHLLEKDGFVESIPRVGYRVKKLAWDELDEIFEIRSVNEILACRWAAKKITAKSLQALEKNVGLSEAVLKKGHPEAFLKYDEEFHEILVRSSGSQHLFELCQQLRRLMLRYRLESIKDEQTVRKALNGHQRILETLKSGDEKGIVDAIVEHLNFSRSNIHSHAVKKTAQP